MPVVTSGGSRMKPMQKDIMYLIYLQTTMEQSEIHLQAGTRMQQVGIHLARLP